MLSRMPSFVAAALLALLALTPIGAHAAEPAGYYKPISGPVSIKLAVPGIVNATIKSPNMGVIGGLLGMTLQFDSPSGTPENFAMHMKLLDTPIKLGGMWTARPVSKFIVKTDLQSLLPLIEEMGGTATITKDSFTGQVMANGNIKANFALGVKIAILGINIKLDMSGSMVGAPGAPPADEQAANATEHAGDGQGATLDPHITLQEFLARQVQTVLNQKQP